MSPEATGTITVPAELDNLREVLELVSDELNQHETCPNKVKHQVAIAIEELFVNVCLYAYADQEEPGNVRATYVYRTDPESIQIQLVDQGVPFNPLTRQDPTKPTSIQDTKVGGLGIYMVRKTMDEFTYAYEDESNVVTFLKTW